MSSQSEVDVWPRNIKITEFEYEIPKEHFSLTEDEIAFLEDLKERRKGESHNQLIRINDETGETQELYMYSGYRHWHVRDGNEYEINHPLWERLSKLFKNTRKKRAYDIMWQAHLGHIPGALKVHVDELAINLNIPLFDPIKPVTFWSSRASDAEMLHQYYYTKYQPVILNARIPHNVIDNDQDRVFLQIGGFNDLNYYELLWEAFRINLKETVVYNSEGGPGY